MKFSKLTRIYTTNDLKEEQTLIIKGEYYFYLKSVLRLKMDSEFRIFNSHEGEFLAKITAIGKNEIFVLVQEKIRELVMCRDLILAICLIKPDCFIEAIRAAVQIGATEIIPIISERTQVKQINEERISKIIIESTEQSERFVPPKLSSIIGLDQLCNRKDIEQIIFANEEEIEKNVKSLGKFAPRIAVLIGPEGGFSAKEKQYLLSYAHCDSVSLGENVLRAEVASTACLACVAMMR